MTTETKQEIFKKCPDCGSPLRDSLKVKLQATVNVGLIKQALLTATEQLRKENEELKQTSSKYRSLLYSCDKHKLWNGLSCIGCIEEERDLAQQRLVKLAKAIKDEISSQTRCSILSKEILSGDFETIDKIV